jgi:hypothetical protein
MMLSTFMLLGLRIQGRGGNVVDLSAVMARCGEAFDTEDVDGSEEVVKVFRSECIRVGIQLWDEVVVPHLDANSIEGLFRRCRDSDIVPALLPTVRCQGSGGSLVEVTGKAINDAFT